MAKAGYAIQTGAAVALSTGVAKSVLAVIAPAQFGIDLRSVEIGFDASTANTAVLVEVCTCTNATNVTPGTNNSTGTVNQIYGRSITAGFTGFYASTSEPTVLTPVDSFTVPPNGGLVIRDYAFGQGLDTAVSTSFVIRCTAQSSVNARATMIFERC
jgi:hypothetical protein